ncbi:UNVERIFIED_CONTAM: hypothetical protein NCL1_34834 [Trichonephila clavipes]
MVTMGDFTSKKRSISGLITLLQYVLKTLSNIFEPRRVFYLHHTIKQAIDDGHCPFEPRQI